MIWLIFALTGVAMISLFTAFFGRMENFSGISKFLFYTLIAVLIVMVIMSVVAWYTQSFNPSQVPGQNSMLITAR